MSDPCPGGQVAREAVQIWGLEFTPDLSYVSLAGMDDGPFDADRSAMALRRFTKLTAVNAAWPVTDRHIEALCTVPSIEWLDLQETSVTDAGLSYLCELPRLSYLRLKDTDVTDVGMATLARIGSLENLQLQETLVTDAGIARLASLDRLQFLCVDSHRAEISLEALASISRLLPEAEVLAKGRGAFFAGELEGG